MAYVDGFVIAVPEANRQGFLDHANHVDTMFIEFGATRVVECWGDDIPDGSLTDFRRAVAAKDGEVIVFAWIEWPDRATRDAGMELIRNDPRTMSGAAPFDVKRMIFGGFEAVVDIT